MTCTEHNALIPVIDPDTCVECGLCQKVCPVLTKGVSPNHVNKCYAAWTTDSQLLENAATAGVVTALGYQTIKQGGVVYGTKFLNKSLTFTAATTLEELLQQQGSKYVHAYVASTFADVKRSLAEGKKVMFTGTPCQIHGLRQYLRCDDDNLLAVDLICHGVAPMAYLNDYLHHHEIDDYDNVVFRGKRGMSMVVTKGGKEVYKKYKFIDLFYTAYLKGLISRENCYQCPYTSLQRYGDITVGDFWGLEHTPEMPKHPFISLVFTNTPKGEQFLKECEDSIRCLERPVEMATQKNGQLSHPCNRHRGRDKFLALYPDKGLVRSIKRTPLYREYINRSLQYRALLTASKLKHLIFHGT